MAVPSILRSLTLNVCTLPKDTQLHTLLAGVARSHNVVNVILEKEGDDGQLYPITITPNEAGYSVSIGGFSATQKHFSKEMKAMLKLADQLNQANDNV